MIEHLPEVPPAKPGRWIAEGLRSAPAARAGPRLGMFAALLASSALAAHAPR